MQKNSSCKCMLKWFSWIVRRNHGQQGMEPVQGWLTVEIPLFVRSPAKQNMGANSQVPALRCDAGRQRTTH